MSDGRAPSPARSRAEAFWCFGSLYGNKALGFPSSPDDHDEPVDDYGGSVTTYWQVQLELILTDLEDQGMKPRPAREYTLDEVASIVGLSRKRVRQIEMKALGKLRNVLEEWRDS